MTDVNYGNEVLVFTVDAVRYAIELKYVTETVQALPLTYVPRLPAYIRGVANLRGNMVPVIELARFFNGRAAAAEIEKYSCLLVLRCEDCLFSILTDNVLCIGDLRENLLNEGMERAAGGFERYVMATLADGDGVVLVLDGEKIFCDMTRGTAGEE